MDKILLQKPDFLAKTEGRPWYLDGQGAALSLLLETLEEEYKLAETVGDFQVFRRLE